MPIGSHSESKARPLLLSQSSRVPKLDGDGSDMTSPPFLPGVSGNPSSKLLISATKDSDGKEKYFYVPLPSSYDAAISTAKDLLNQSGDEEDSQEHHGNPGQAGLRLELRVKTPDGRCVWASIIPQTWSTMLKDGDEIRVIQEGMYGEFDDKSWGPIAFEYLIQGTNKDIRATTSVRITSYKNAKLTACESLRKDLGPMSPKDISLRICIGAIKSDPDGLSWSKISKQSRSGREWAQLLADIRKITPIVVLRVLEKRNRSSSAYDVRVPGNHRVLSEWINSQNLGGGK